MIFLLITLVKEDRDVTREGKYLSKQTNSEDLGYCFKYTRAVDYKNTFRLHLPFTEGYPYAVVRAHEYLNFLEDAMDWESSLKVIALEQ